MCASILGVWFSQAATSSSIGQSEKHKSWKYQKKKAHSEPRHNTDFRTVFGIDIGLLVFCEIRQIYFTESKGRFETTSCSDFKLFSAICQKEKANSKPRHSTDFRTLFRITIRRFVSCEIRQTYFTESKGSIALYLMILYGIV